MAVRDRNPSRILTTNVLMNARIDLYECLINDIHVVVSGLP
jgi:hypothetical protein